MKIPKCKIFVINLDSSKERWRECQKQLPIITFERISAINGADLSDVQLNECFDVNLNKWQYHKTLTAGEIGCYMSHRKAWEKIIEENLDFAVVLEDDFLLNGSIEELVDNIAKITQSWHCIKLAKYPVKRKELTSYLIDMFRLVTYDKVPTRTCAQAISKEGAKRLLRVSSRFGRPVDIDMQYWWEHDLTIFGLKPYIFNLNDSSESDIERIFSRKKAHSRSFSKILQQVYFYVENNNASKNFISRCNRYNFLLHLQ
jgi:glycosyl transferase family 25